MLASRLLLVVAYVTGIAAVKPKSVSLSGSQLRLTWTHTSDGWTSQLQSACSSGHWCDESAPTGQNAVVYNLTSAAQNQSLVELGQTGSYVQFLPDEVSSSGGLVTTTKSLNQGIYSTKWWIDSSRSKELIAVNVTWAPSAAGWYSIDSPRIAVVSEDDLGWGVVPGYWSSNEIVSNHELEYTYVQGVPSEHMVSLEASTTSLVAILSSKSTGTNVAVMADPSLARDPYPSSSPSAQTQWNVGLSLRTRDGVLSPTAHYPVLGQAHSQMESGSSITATFLYAVAGHPDTWYDVNKFVHNEVYPIREYGDRAQDIVSLSERSNRIHDFLVTPESLWHLWTYENLTMGAESGKLSDVGGMWMTQRMTDDPFMLAERLPYARNFKLGQQDTSGDVFNGAALGEYYLDGEFVSELVWVHSSSPDYVSPIYTTFYILQDVGNILLFNKTDQLLLERFSLAAEKLLSWQKSDGSFDVGYLKSDPSTHKYPELTDNRATWYGFVAAYRVLGDAKYLRAAEKGAHWFINAAIKTGRWIGVCDDSMLYPDFSTIFAAQALLDLYHLTNKQVYLDSAVSAAQFYTLHIFNHPAVTDATKTQGNETLQDWQLSQVAMNYEHAGFTGSVNSNGPITIASHAGCFLRMFEITKDTFFRDLAKYAARGRDAYVDPQTSMVSYYWISGDTAGEGYPWHGWWHICWMMDYFMANAHVLSDGAIEFPAGFITAKVGSHVPYGFAPGKIYGTEANLWQPRSLVSISDPEIDYITARSTDGKTLFIMMMNEVAEDKEVTLKLDPRSLEAFKVATWGATKDLASSSQKIHDNNWRVQIPSDGMAVLSIHTSLDNDPLGPEFRNFTIAGNSSDVTISWSFWKVVESWAQWSVPHSNDWHSLPRSTNYTFSDMVDLSGLDAEYVKIRVVSKDGHIKGYSEPVKWTLNG